MRTVLRGPELPRGQRSTKGPPIRLLCIVQHWRHKPPSSGPNITFSLGGVEAGGEHNIDGKSGTTVGEGSSLTEDADSVGDATVAELTSCDILPDEEEYVEEGEMANPVRSSMPDGVLGSPGRVSCFRARFLDVLGLRFGASTGSTRFGENHCCTSAP